MHICRGLPNVIEMLHSITPQQTQLSSFVLGVLRIIIGTTLVQLVKLYCVTLWSWMGKISFLHKTSSQGVLLGMRWLHDFSFKRPLHVCKCSYTVYKFCRPRRLVLNNCGDLLLFVLCFDSLSASAGFWQRLLGTVCSDIFWGDRWRQNWGEGQVGGRSESSYLPYACIYICG